MTWNYNRSDSSLPYSETESERSNPDKTPRKIIYVATTSNQPFIVRRPATAEYSPTDAARVDRFINAAREVQEAVEKKERAEEALREERRLRWEERLRQERIVRGKLSEEVMIERMGREERMGDRMEDQRAALKDITSCVTARVRRPRGSGHGIGGG